MLKLGFMISVQSITPEHNQTEPTFFIGNKSLTERYLASWLRPSQSQFSQSKKPNRVQYLQTANKKETQDALVTNAGHGGRARRLDIIPPGPPVEDPLWREKNHMAGVHLESSTNWASATV
ncbi:uncharacterized protein Z518_00078 [Rhinocladiella mackenziei CBS 650.93]|uniref:Uncharacterized protein n=1 Tax=Rhinocladiella mackenziei CBS 650.93 TaxID=1442369 RepID=A0A0D2JI38_9EURO|nr:uncharacterized protein Z518_00078 [Rhinocladiella mackenziei CBS 650.93]KIX09000.1 hypothetical protein Z518_00078 [Rhinocladiella mackenziei CBS 650.93]